MFELAISPAQVVSWYEEYRNFRDPRVKHGTTFEKWARNYKAKGRPMKLVYFIDGARTKRNQDWFAKIECLNEIDAMKLRLVL